MTIRERIKKLGLKPVAYPFFKGDNYLILYEENPKDGKGQDIILLSPEKAREIEREVER